MKIKFYPFINKYTYNLGIDLSFAPGLGEYQDTYVDFYVSLIFFGFSLTILLEK